MVTQRAILLLSFIGYCLVDAGPAVGQESGPAMACDEREKMVGHLGTKYHEAPIAVGLANNGGLLEILTSEDGATWTAIVSMPNGISCLLAAGEGWENRARKAPEEAL